MKVALAYHRARGEGHRNLFIGREKGYHGVGFGGMSVGGIPANRKVFGTALLPRVDHMRFIHDPVNHAYIHNQEPEWKEDPLLELEQRILPLHDPSNVAAIIVEPVAGSAGWYLPPKGYLKRLREICDKHGILLIFDEVITGFGRMGTNFARRLLRRRARHAELRQVRHQRRDPAGRRDLPRQAVRRDDEDRRARARGRVLPRLHLLGPPGGLRRGHRHAGPVQAGEACSSAPARWARCWAMRSTATFKGLPNVIGIRSLGLAAAVELAPIAGSPGKRAYDIFLDCFHKGALVRPAGDVLVIAPPYIVEKSHIDQLVNTLADAIKANA